MSDTVIHVKNLSKQYFLGGSAPSEGFRHAIENAVTAPFRRLKNLGKNSGNGAKKSAAEFWALKNVSFDIQRGEVVGIIGRNGAGKSTLLKILSRITEQTTGRIEIKGRVASLLEVGTGFHPELTGRENIFLNGAILGMSRTEIRRKFDEIVAFAEVEQFLDTPVKRYSSGMYVRLAFAVAAHMEPEILIVDEVLAVGDAEFQKKCLRKMQSVASQDGRTVLFVSHNMAAVMRLCQKGLLLDRGTVAAYGNAETVVAQYFNVGSAEKSEFVPDPAKPPGSDIITLISAAVRSTEGATGPNFGAGSTLEIEILYRIVKPLRGLRIGFHLHSADGTIIFNAIDSDKYGAGDSGRPERTGIYVSRCRIPSNFLNRGQYTVTVGSDAPLLLNFYCENVISFVIEPDGSSGIHMDNRPGLICPSLRWEIEEINGATGT